MLNWFKKKKIENYMDINPIKLSQNQRETLQKKLVSQAFLIQDVYPECVNERGFLPFGLPIMMIEDLHSILLSVPEFEFKRSGDPTHFTYNGHGYELHFY